MKKFLAKFCFVAAFASIPLSLYTYYSANVDAAIYTGLWVPCFFHAGWFFEGRDNGGW